MSFRSAIVGVFAFFGVSFAQRLAKLERLWYYTDVRHKFSRLRHRVFVLLLLFTVVPLSVVGIAFYLYSRQTAVDGVNQQSDNYLTVISNSLHFLLRDVSETSLDLIRSDNLRDTLSRPGGIRIGGWPPTQQIRLVGEMNYTAASKPYIHSITLFDNDGDRVSTYSRRFSYGSSLEAALDQAGAGSWRLLATPELPNESHSLVLVRLVRDYRNLLNHIGFLAINLDQSELRSMLRDGAPFESTRSFLVDERGTVLAAGARDVLDAYVDEVVSDGEDTVVHRRPVTDFPFTIVQISDSSDVFGSVRTIGIFLLLSLAGMIVICALIAALFSTRVVAPITELSGLLRRVEENNFQITAPVRGKDEIAELAQQFNAMVRRIRVLFHEVYVAQIHERDAELRALQSQINPHFLHNTLASLYMNARLESAPETGNLIKEFAALMRYSMQTDRPLVSLEEEIEHTDSYLALQKHRIGDKMTYRWEIEEISMDHEVLRLILQPIVENAVFHGTETPSQQAEIVVRVFTDSSSVCYEVTDNGPGLGRASTENDNGTKESGSGMGLRNVRERLELYFGDRYELKFQSSASSGTRVTVRQPVGEHTEHA